MNHKLPTGGRLGHVRTFEVSTAPRRLVDFIYVSRTRAQWATEALVEPIAVRAPSHDLRVWLTPQQVGELG